MYTFANRNFAIVFALILATVITVAAQPTAKPALWSDPGDIQSRDLRYGTGSPAKAPKGPFTFVEEVKGGSSPKIIVTDGRGVKWVVKLGEEAQSETVASRIVWAVGYLAEEAYYLKEVEIRNLPVLDRGTENAVKGNVLRGVRFEPRRPDEQRGNNWEWLENPFVGTREFDGLKILMVLLSNYDTRIENNRIIQRKDPQTGEMQSHYIVSDLGATFGRVGGLGGKRSKNALDDYREGRFVVGVENGLVEFDYRTRPEGIGVFASILNPRYGKSQHNKEKAMRRISVESARWIGTLLSSLSDDQFRDAFAAAGYDDATAQGFITVLRSRIGELTL